MARAAARRDEFGFGRFASAAVGRLGPLDAVIHQRTPPDFDFLHAVTVVIRQPHGNKDVVAAGGSFTRLRAEAAAFGEALERHALGGGRPTGTWPMAQDRPAGQHICPSELLHFPEALYGRADMGLSKPSPGQPLYWLGGRELVRGGRIGVPAFAVFAAACAQTPDGVLLDAPVSTGAACGRTRTQALLTGLYEVIERDAFTLHWENRRPAEPPACLGRVAGLGRILQQRGFVLHLGRLANDTGVPVALAVVEDICGGRAAVALGCAARARWSDAAWRAVEEAVLTSFWITSLHAETPASPAEVLAEMEGMAAPERHAFLYGFAEMRSRASFL